ncbi:hypothetical protein BABINDRAFT_169477 [Babjeviella inositovora NRRL Y-12698]|uniref:ADP-ribosylation factor-like protein 2 n=1 Tax=Babjeviella inositovora NRRL Y-12698 TaxID=984486 RepID=A0A1E3QHG3_9ASCO|nr:uncharacterized protein BABINDRAFT_169477 [Babjeviella inositovora NRRL Y-12698]ODQ77135.1 hypothetical protein BABINDRAFT_169477 [Babjeviella inositovora NRRL Y-12698]
MGLLTIIKKQKLKDKEVRVLMLGLDNSGKSSILNSLLKKSIDDIPPTMGFNIETLLYRNFTMNIWDIGGQSTLRPFWFNYFEKTDSLVWVIDGTTYKQRLYEIAEEFLNILKQDNLIIGCNFLIMINKIDLLFGAEDIDKTRRASKLQEVTDEIIHILKLKEMTNHSWKIIPVSAKTGENVDTAIDWVVDEIKERLYIL